MINDRTKIVEMLESSRQEVIAAVRSIPEAQAGVKPAPDRWSTLECVEHLAAVEERFLGRLASAERLPEARPDPEKETRLAAMIANRFVRAEAPEPVRPKSRFASVEEALAHFNEVRSRTIQFAEQRAADLPLLAVEHVRFGALNGVELTIVLAGHARRHAEQIREIAK